MLKLICLEWKKNRIVKYCCNAAILTALLMIFIFAMAKELDANATIDMYGKSMLNVAVDLFSHMSYIVFTGVMLSTFIVSTYEKKTIHVMFSYPLKRQKILLSKMLAVWIFNFLALIITKLIIFCGLIITKSYTGISTENIQLGDVSFLVQMIVSSAVMISISFVALMVGLKMKSSKATIITAVVVTCFTQGNIGSYTLADSIPFYIILFVLAIVSVILSIRSVEIKDVM